MRILIVSANAHSNIGDTLTCRGGMNLLREACGPDTDFGAFDYLKALGDPEYVLHTHHGKVDAVAVLGTPWLWIDCFGQAKYRLMFELRDRYPDVPFIGLGLGSMFERAVAKGLTEGSTDHFWNAPFHGLEKLRKLYQSFALVATRDCVARMVFEQLGVPVLDTMDIAAFAGFTHKPCEHEKAALFFMHMGRENEGQFLDAPIGDYVEAQLAWAKDIEAHIFVNSPSDLGILEERGLDGYLVNDLDCAANILGRFEDVFSARVHMAILAKLVGVPAVMTLPFDTRYLTATRFGIPPKFIGEQGEYLHPEDAKAWDAADERRKLLKGIRGALPMVAEWF